MPDIKKIITPDNQEYNVKDLDAIHSIEYRAVEGQLVVYYTKDGVSGTGFLTVDSTATQNSNNPITSGYVYTALNEKVDKMTGYGLSSNDYTTTEKQKLAGLSNPVSTYSPTGTAPVNGTAVKASMTGTLDSTDSNHSATSKAVADSQAEQDAEIAVIANAGAKSLLPIGVSSITYANAVTFSVAYDGTITVNGTNSNGYAGIPYADLVTAKDLIYETRYTLPIGKYKITSTGNGLKFQVYCHDGTSVHSQLFSDKSSGEFEYTSALKTQYPYICWRLVIDANASFSNQIIKPMIWNAEIKDSTFQQFALSNPVITPALVNQVDGGAKNKLHITQLGSSDANVGTKVTSQGVEYEIQSDGTITAYRKASSSSGAYIFLYENGSVKDVSEFFDGQHVWSGNPSQYPSTVSVWYKIGSGSNVTMPDGTLLPNANGESVRIGFQISSSASPTQSDPIVFKPMICSISDWQVSQKFVPYCPTMQELYQMILALQNG